MTPTVEPKRENVPVSAPLAVSYASQAARDIRIIRIFVVMIFVLLLVFGVLAVSVLTSISNSVANIPY